MRISSSPTLSSPRHRYPSTIQPIALIVLLENVGHVVGLRLPGWVMSAIDYVTEEYAKFLLRLYGAKRVYDRVVILEDRLATSANLSNAILHLSRTHRVDLLLLVHGKEGTLVGHRGLELIGSETFDALLRERKQDPAAVNLRMVFGLNCYGASLAQTWLQLGAVVVNGAPGVNWLPEPSLSIFLRNWLTEKPYSLAVMRSNTHSRRWGARVWRGAKPGVEHEKISSSRQMVYGSRDVNVRSRA